MNQNSKLYGVDLFGESMSPQVTSPVSKKFLIPPFSVLNAREGDWQERKRAWRDIGILGEIGRDAAAIHCPNSSSEESLEDANYTSIFDPVLCELSYMWFSQKGDTVIDPFAGGSVRGIVASCLGRKYWGCDLREEQIKENEIQGEAICDGVKPKWVCGDSFRELDKAPEADFIFSCPPYGDLEEYSNNPADLSSMTHDVFLSAYRDIVSKACKKLKQNRFACFVVGDFRDKKGNYRNFVSNTIQAFLDAGMNYYNEAILVTSVGSASMRVSKQFEASRKFAKTHQNILVFVKGDGKKASRTKFCI